MSSGRTIVDVDIAAPPGEVWRALREPAVIAQWVGWDYPGLEEEIGLIFIRSIAAEEPGQRLAFLPYEGVSDAFALTPSEKATRLQILRDGGTVPANGFDGMVEDWRSFVEQMRFLLERSPGVARRTIRLSGSAKQAGPVLTEMLGLRPAGSASMLQLPGGEAAGITAWHETAFQRGAMIEPWGPGLLIATNRPAHDKVPFGGGSMLITTYGQSNEAFETLRQRLEAWWSERFST